MLSFKEFSKQIDENRLQRLMNFMGKRPGRPLGTIIGATIGTASALADGGDLHIRGPIGGLIGGALGANVDRLARLGDKFDPDNRLRKAKKNTIKTET